MCKKRCEQLLNGTKLVARLTHTRDNKDVKLTVGAEVVDQDDLLNEGRRTSHQDTEQKQRGAAEWGQHREKGQHRSGQERFFLPFDGPQQSGASLIMEGNDDAGGGKVGVIVDRPTPAEK